MPNTSTVRPRAFTLDLDDTLWPIEPTLRGAEAALRGWLAVHAPATLAGCGDAGMLRLRAQVALDHPELAHDLSALRLITIHRALIAAGDDPALAEPAFEAFMAARQQVTWFDDVRPALDRLAAHGPLLAVSNGNAELGATGLAQCFELTQQLRGTADRRQVDGVKLALQHNLGLGGACVVTLYGRNG